MGGGGFICFESVIDRCSVEASFFYSVSFYHKIRWKLIDSNFNLFAGILDFSIKIFA